MPLIDSHFDQALASQLARLESYNKHNYRPNSYLHKWWARRCGSTFRLILKNLAQDPEQSAYDRPGGLEGKLILDPMMGGGTTLHEAIRLGANVIGADLEPIPVLQARATLSSEPPLDRLESAFGRLLQALQEAVGELFCTQCPLCGKETDLQFTLYGLRRRCDCGPVLLVDSLVLRHETDNSSIDLCPRCHAITGSQDNHHCAGPLDLPLIEKTTRRCPRCHAPYQEEVERPFFQRYQPLAVVGRCAQHGLFFRQPGPADLHRLAEANRRRPAFPLEPFLVQPGPKSSDLIRRGIRAYLDLFSSRQLLYLQTALQHLNQVEDPLRLNLALLISTSLEFNTMLCGYKGANSHRPGAIRHAFARHAYAFPYTALENNPLYPRQTSGTLVKLFHDRIRRARLWAARPVERVIQNGKTQVLVMEGEKDSGCEVHRPSDLLTGTRRFLLLQGSSASLPLPDQSVEAIVTDPPYFDSVQYSDLAAFFRVWLRQALPDQACWNIDRAQSAVDPEAQDGVQYQQVLSAIWTECHRLLVRPEGRLIFTFHHWNPRGWAALTLALRQARFSLVNYYVVHSENPVSVHIANLRALVHDAILVLAPSETGPKTRWPPVPAVNQEDSYHFCQDCASVLGWMLEADLDELEIENLWLDLLTAPGS